MNSTKASIRGFRAADKSKWKRKERDRQRGGKKRNRGRGGKEMAKRLKRGCRFCKPDPLFGLGYIDFERVDTVCIKF